MENNDIAALICVVAPLAGAVLLAGLALLWRRSRLARRYAVAGAVLLACLALRWLLFGAASELRMLFVRWLDRR